MAQEWAAPAWEAEDAGAEARLRGLSRDDTLGRRSRSFACLAADKSRIRAISPVQPNMPVFDSAGRYCTLYSCPSG